MKINFGVGNCSFNFDSLLQVQSFELLFLF